MLKSINALFLTTKNMASMIEFYQTLGAPLELSNHGRGLHAECDFGDLHFALHPAQDDSTSHTRFSFSVPNLEEYCNELKTKGLKFVAEPVPQSFGGVTAEINDPDGNRIFLTRWQSDEEYAKNFPTQPKE